MTIQYLSLEEILRLHFQVIEDYGGSHGIRAVDRLASLAQAPLQTAFGQEQYPSVSQKAAVYLRNIIGDHPFTDGNKRTAVTVCGIFLARNGRKLSCSPRELEQFAVQAVTDRLDISTIAAWLEAHTAAA